LIASGETKENRQPTRECIARRSLSAWWQRPEPQLDRARGFWRDWLQHNSSSQQEPSRLRKQRFLPAWRECGKLNKHKEEEEQSR